jgi:hypothetical protein
LWLSLEAKYKRVNAKEDLVKTFVLLTCSLAYDYDWHLAFASLLYDTEVLVPDLDVQAFGALLPLRYRLTRVLLFDLILIPRFFPFQVSAR